MLYNFYKTYNFFDYFKLNKLLDSTIINEIEQNVSTLDFEKGIVSDSENKSLSRKSNIKWIYNNHNTLKIFEHLSKTIITTNNQHFNFSIKGSKDPLQYVEYSSNIKGYYDWHQDDIFNFEPNIPLNFLRKLSLTIQLSDPNEYEGGDLEISLPQPEKNIIVKVPREKGKIIIFPSYLFHRITPVTKGIRKSLVWWVGGSPFK